MIVGPRISGQSKQSPEKPRDNNAERRSELATSFKQNERCLQELKDDNMQLGLELATTIGQLRDDNVQLATTIGQLRDDNVQLATAIGQLRDDNVQLATTIGQLRHDNVQLATTIGQLRHDNVQLATTIEQLRDNNVQLRSELAITIGQLRDDNVQLRSEVDKHVQDLRQISKRTEKYLEWVGVCSKSYRQLQQNSGQNTTKIQTLEETIERMTQQDGMERNRAQEPTTRIGQKEQHSLRLEHDEEQETAEQSSHNEEVSKVLPNWPYRCDWRGCPFKPTTRFTNLTKHKTDCHRGEGHSRYLCYQNGCYNSKHPHGFSSQHWVSRHIEQFHPSITPTSLDSCAS